MRFSRWFVAALILMLTLAVLAPAAAQEDAEATVVILRDGETFEGVFEGFKTAQLFGFNASAGDVVNITMTQEDGSDLDPFVVLLGERGQVIAANDDAENANPVFASAIEDLELPYDGSYFIMATSFLYIDNILDESEAGLTEPQNYELSISGITPPTGLENFDDTQVSLYNSEVEIGTDAPAETTLEEPVYYLKFTGQQGDKVTFTTSSSDFDTIIHIFDPEGIRVAVNDDADGTNSAIEGFKLPMNGEYLIFVTDVFFYNAPEGDFDSVGEFQIKVS